MSIFRKLSSAKLPVASILLAVLVTICGPLEPLSADEIILRSGGRIEGEVLREEERGDETVAIIQTANGGQLILPKSSIRDIKSAPAALADYEDLKLESGDTIEDHLKVAEFCLRNGLSDLRNYHMWQVIRLDPENEEARRALRFTRINGEWTTPEQFNRRQGYVRDTRGWRLPADLELERAREDAELRVIDWRKKLEGWESNLKRNRRVDQAMAGIRSINDPAAIVPLAELLRDAESRDAKELWLGALMQIDHPAILGPLREMTLLESDDRIREKCLKKVVEHPVPASEIFYRSHLDPNKNSATVINRAGYALEALGSKDSVRFLIEALSTVRKVPVGQGNSGGGQRTNVGFGSNGGGGLTVGDSGPKTVDVLENHEGVLSALRAITGQDYRFDKDAWKDWYVDHSTPRGIDLRRAED